MIVISDTSPITSLAAVGELDLLRQLYTKILITEAVYRELTATSTPVPGSVEVRTFDWIEVRQVTNRSLIAVLLEQQLDEGECQAIALAISPKQGNRSAIASAFRRNRLTCIEQIYPFIK